jgi:hypothetical protein
MKNNPFSDMFRADIEEKFPFGLSIGRAGGIRGSMYLMSITQRGSSYHGFNYP